MCALCSIRVVRSVWCVYLARGAYQVCTFGSRSLTCMCVCVCVCVCVHLAATSVQGEDQPQAHHHHASGTQHRPAKPHDARRPPSRPTSPLPQGAQGVLRSISSHYVETILEKAVEEQHIQVRHTHTNIQHIHAHTRTYNTYTHTHAHIDRNNTYRCVQG